MAGISANPYVGPRPFPRGKRLYGRDRELRELFDLLVARRIVLLHSPSGAGKSSLVQAALIPRLKRERFDVWRTVRLNLDPGALEGEVENRFVASTLASLEDGVPEAHRRNFAAITGKRLAEYLEARPRRPGAPPSVALVFDQFEEILTVDPFGTGAKREFFAQLGEALRQGDFWALFALREDYLAALSPYRDLMPTKLANTYRIDLLGGDAALEAIVEPARDGGRKFPAADLLVNDLRTMQVQQPDGSFVAERGLCVEPVQLQVVCLRLWDAMPDDDLSIDPEDLEQFGDVGEALGHYYRASVKRIAARQMARERQIRHWFGQRLMATGGVRGQVLREAETSGGLANEIIEKLLDAHLVRAEKRAGATWYELAHDRLIEPIKNDNANWQDQHFSEVQRRASLWEQEERPSGLLLQDLELVEGEYWAAENEASLTEVDRLFLEASRTAQAATEGEERRQALMIRRLAVAAMIASILALVAGGIAVAKWREAVVLGQKVDAQIRKAEVQKKIAEEQRREAERHRQDAEDALKLFFEGAESTIKELAMLSPQEDLTGIYTIRQKATGRSFSASEKGGYGLVVREAQNADLPRWILTPLGKDVYTIRHEASGRYVDAHEKRRQDYGLMTREVQNDDLPRWILTPLGEDVYTIQQKANDRYIDTRNSRLVTRKARYSDSQKWVIRKFRPSYEAEIYVDAVD